MGEMIVKDKDIVTPGEVLAKGIDFLPSTGAFREDDLVISNQLGMVNVNGRLIKIIPLRGKYCPKRNDTIIGRIADMSFSVWFVDIGCSNDAIMSIREVSDYVEKGADLAQYYAYGDLVVAKVSQVNKSTADISMKGPGLRKLRGGVLIKVDSPKVPRIIGKQGSMISMVKEKTGCRITVGQNGYVWIQGEPQNEVLAVETIKKINNESHVNGLTESIEKFLNEKMKGVKNVQEKV